jgi:hypothetical protein
MSEKESSWPERMTCEVSGCGRIIHPKTDQFSLIEIKGNVIITKGSVKSDVVDAKYVACASCSKKLNSTKFKRRNRNIGLD